MSSPPPPLSPLARLVRAMAQMMCADCRFCGGLGTVMARTLDESKPCPACGDVVAALREVEG